MRSAVNGGEHPNVDNFIWDPTPLFGASGLIERSMYLVNIFTLFYRSLIIYTLEGYSMGTGN